MLSSSQSFLFCLGGRDLEMLTIKQLLRKQRQAYLDKALAWGAAASAYQKEIETALQEHITPVLIELEWDITCEPVIIIDHHGAYAGETQPTALHQVFKLLELPDSQWTRWFELVAANDRGYIPALQALKASQSEIIQIRKADRRVQGISAVDDVAAMKAINTMEVVGDVSIIHLTHHRTSAVADALEPALGGVGFRNLLIISPQEVNFFGEGQWVLLLSTQYPEGWYGGALPTRGFWGCQQIDPPQVMNFLLSHINR